MKIEFNKEYDEDTRWTKILLEFLDHLGEQYYPESGLDEYDLLGIIWEARLDKLGDLVNEGNTPALSMFDEVAKKSFAWKATGNRLREEYRETLETLIPKKKDV